MTHQAVLVTPLEARLAVGHVRSWFEQPNVQVFNHGTRHLETLARLFDAHGTAGA
jgi:hypothetical protein